jgi:hypothetical protein
MLLPVDDLLGRVYEMNLYTGNTISGHVVFTVQEVDPETDTVIAVDNHTLQRQTLSHQMLSDAVWAGKDVWESALPPYGG